ncbi:MAG: class I SAM-dependent methyltransferase [Tepidiformaceae bacterium]
MPPDFYRCPGLNVDVYTLRTASLGVVEGDVEFYTELALASGRSALELGCGTGRLLIPLARAGVSVTGLDLAQPMLAVAAERIAKEPPALQKRITLVEGNMVEFALARRFDLAFIAFRSFMFLTEPADQRRCLECIHAHLEPGGRLAIDIFDPRLDLLTPTQPVDDWTSLGGARHPVSNNMVEVHVADRSNDTVAQVFEEIWRFTELDDAGEVLRQEEEVLRMRWTYRHEMRYLLELCGFTVEAEYSDYDKSPPAYGLEQIWVARRG